jgi:carbonic anhydrase
LTRVFHFDTQDEVYHADACVISCFDARFELVVRKFLQRRGFGRVDHIRMAGGVKALASPGDESERSFTLAQIRVSVRLHGTDLVVLLAHADCGGYGGRAAYGGDPEREIAGQSAELRKAAAVIKGAIPELAVACYFLNFDGVWEVPHASS